MLSLLLAAGFVSLSRTAFAADPDTSNGITVDSTLDTSDVNVGDGVCDDGAGNCTLRAAIEEANSNIDTTAIDFAISGTGLHTLTPSSPLPTITTKLSIDGYTQAGSQVNTATSPQPFNGTLTIEIDGTGIARAININEGACLSVTNVDQVEIKGLVINNCGNDGIRLENSSYAKIQGNYIGTDSTGMLDKGNGRDYTVSSIGNGIFMNASNNVLIGGPLPANRNIIAGNQAGDIFWGNEQDNVSPSENNVVQGNYIGVGADGQTPLPSGYAWGLGNAILFGNSHNDIIGGDNNGESNVIGSSYEYGVAFRDGSSGTVIQGNFIGTDYTGTQSMPHTYGAGNSSTGIHVGEVSQIFPNAQPHDVLIGGPTAGARNIISGNRHTGGANIAGVGINDGAYNVTVQNNYIGVDSSGTNPIPNDFGVYMDTSYGIPDTHNNLIGGTGANEGNLISGNNLDGIAVVGSGAYNNSFIGNSIVGNGGLGIDLGENGFTPNDSHDTDTGPNGLLNSPVLTNLTEGGGNTTVDYTLDVPAGSYRVEFFNNPYSISDFSEGEIILGYQTVTSTGTGTQAFSTSLSGTGHTSVTATATKIEASTPSGFGNSSEFSMSSSNSSTSVTKTLDNPQDVAAGATLNYTITITNNGPAELDLSQFNGSNFNPFLGSLFVDILPPELTFNGVDGNDVACTDVGPGSASLAPFFTNHNDYGLVLCTYAGAPASLQTGESFSATIHATVANTPNLDFTNYVLGAPNPTDADYGTITNAFGDADIIDSLTDSAVNNLASANSVTQQQQPDPEPTTTPTTPSVLPSVGAASLITMFMLIIASAAAFFTFKARRHTSAKE